MFSEPTRIPPLSDNQREGLLKRRWKQYHYSSLALYLYMNERDEFTIDQTNWKKLQELCQRQARAWIKLNDGLEYATLERRLYDIESEQKKAKERPTN
jgi:hypothetical protein